MHCVINTNLPTTPARLSISGATLSMVYSSVCRLKTGECMVGLLLILLVILQNMRQQENESVILRSLSYIQMHIYML